MNRKENKGGTLRNSQIEEELNRQDAVGGEDRGYRGTQDTGDRKPRTGKAGEEARSAGGERARKAGDTVAEGG